MKVRQYKDKWTQGLTVYERKEEHVRLLTALDCGTTYEVCIASAHRDVFKHRWKLDLCRMPSRYVPPVRETMEFFSRALELLGNRECYCEASDARRARVYVKALKRLGKTNVTVWENFVRWQN